MSRDTTNPWGLTPQRCEVMDQLACGKNPQQAAAALGVTVGTLRNTLAIARTKMSASGIYSVVLWDRYARDGVVG